MTNRDNVLWQQCWRDRKTSFHQSSVNSLLTKYWAWLELGAGSRVFVPLCGMSLDMIWLAEQGHEVIGVELSAIAVRTFFLDNHLKPVRTRNGKFDLWQHGNLSILCGDYFALTKEDLGQIDAVYDRASLTALGEDIRGQYVAQLRLLVPDACKILMVTIEDADEWETAEQALASADEINALYANDFDVVLMHVESTWETDPESSDQASLHTMRKVYRLGAKAGAKPRT
jgi:thiopurine S-methyltransferase